MKHVIAAVLLVGGATVSTGWAQTQAAPDTAAPAAAPAETPHPDAIVRMHQEVRAARQVYNRKVAAARKVFDAKVAEYRKERDEAIAAARSGTTGQQ